MRQRFLSVVVILILLFSAFVKFPYPIIISYASEHSQIPCTQRILLHEQKDFTRYFHFDWSPDDINWTMSDQGMIANLEDHAVLNLPGKPMLPYQLFSYDLSPRQHLVYVKTTKLNSVMLPLFSQYIPIAGEPFVFREEEMNRFRFPVFESYNTQCFPEDNFEIAQLSEQGQQSFRLFIYPIYILKGQMHLVTKLSLEIGLKTENEFEQPLGTPSNTNAVVLCPDELSVPAKTLQKLQETDGYKVRVITLSEARKYPPSEEPAMNGILGFNDYPDSQKTSILSYDLDTALRIRTLLKTLLKENKIGFLTILGDALYVPPSYYVSSEDGYGEYEQWLPTDYFYIAPEAKGDHYSFDINVGRLPARSLEDAEKMVDKLRRYRKALRPSWFKNVALMGGDPFDRDYFGEMVLNDAVNRDLFKGMTIRRFFKTEGLYSTKAVLDGFRSAENGFLWALGHGTGDGLALEPGRVDAKDIMDLPKNDLLPIVISESCDNGAFDSRIVRPAYRSSVHFKDPTSFSEAVMLSEGAGVAYIGGVRSNFGGWIKEYNKGVLDIQYLYYTDAMITHFFEHYAMGPSTLGDLVRNAMFQYMKEDWFNYFTHTKTFFGFTFQGDPTLKLPFLGNEGKKSIPAPELTYQEEMPLTYDSLPLFSMNDGINIKAKSDSSKLTYIISDYLDDENPVCEKGDWKKNNINQYQHYFVPDRKTMMTIRIQAEDFKERRIVFYSRYNYDVVIHQEEDLRLLNLNETKDYSFTLANEGIFKAENIRVSVQSSSDMLKEYNVPLIPIMSSRSMYFSFTGKDPGEVLISMKASVLDQETVPSDNEDTLSIRVSREPIARVGILQASDLNSKEYYEGRLIIRQLNQQFRENGQPVEVCVVPVGKDNKQLTSLNRLDLDMIVLYTPYFYSHSTQDLLYHLEQFERNGGSVLGISSLGYNQFGYLMTELQEFFGIRRTEGLYMFYEPEHEIDLNILDDKDYLFSLETYHMRSRFFVSSGSSWDNVALTHASLVAISDDQQTAMTQSGSRYFYSGYLAEQDMVFEDDALLFLSELMAIPLRERLDISIQSVFIDPVEGSNGKTPNLTVRYKNVGNIPAENLTLKLNQEITYDLPSLLPNETATYNEPISLGDHPGTQEITVEIVSKGAKKETNIANNTYHFVYNGGSGKTPTKISLLIDGNLERNVAGEAELVSGKVTVGSQLFINEKRVAGNTDGSFSTLLKLNEGVQDFHFLAFLGKEKSEMVTLRLNRQRNMLIQLRINDPVPYYNYQPGNALEAPPFIYQSLTYVPLRMLAEAFGSSLEYDASQRKISIQYNSLVIHMIIGESQATVESPSGTSIIQLQGPCIIVKGRSFVPIRFIAETFGAKVDWNADLELVSITRMIDLPEVSPPEMDTLIDTAVPSSFFNTVLDGRNEGKLLYPTCIEPTEDGTLLISSFDGLYHWDLDNEPEKLYDFEEWKTGFLTEFDWYKANASPNRVFFRQWGENIILSDRSNLAVIDPKTDTLLRSIPNINFATYPYPKQNFTEMCDLEIEGNMAYVLNLWEGITMIDLLSGEVTCQYPLSNYPVSFTVENNMITSAGFFGDITRLDLMTGEITIYRPSTAVYPQSIFQNRETYYLQLIHPKGIFEVKLSDRKISLGTAKKISNRYNYHAEQLCFLEQGTYGLIVDPDSLESGLSKLNSNFAVDSRLFEETRIWLEENPNFNITVDQTWITGDDQILITQQSPGDTSLLKLYNFKGEWQKDITIELETEESEILGIQYIGSSTVIVLILDEKYFVQEIQFENLKNVQIHTVELRLDPNLVAPIKWTADARYLCIWDGYSAKNIVVDRKNGREIRRFDTYSLDHNPVYLSDHRIMHYMNNQLYVFDVISGIMRVFDAKGKIQHQWNISTAYRGLFPYVCDVKIINENEFALLDQYQSKILFVKDGAVHRSIDGFLSPVSMDIKDQHLLVNNMGRFEVNIASISEDQEKSPTLMVFPVEYFAEISYPKEWSALMLIQQWDHLANIAIEHPKELQYEYINKGDQSVLIRWKLSDSEFIEQDITGNIMISTDKTKVKVPVHIIHKPVQVEINTFLIKKGTKILYPTLPNKIEKETLFMEFMTLQDIFSFTCTEMKGDLMIAMPKDTLLIKTKEGKATLMSQSGSQPFDLGAPLQTHKGHYWIPMNAIFKHLSLVADTTAFPIIFQLTSDLISNSDT